MIHIANLVQTQINHTTKQIQIEMTQLKLDTTKNSHSSYAQQEMHYMQVRLSSLVLHRGIVGDIELNNMQLGFMSVLGKEEVHLCF
jgi:hypothetical protein